MKLQKRRRLFLLESVEGGEKWGRYTFLGADPKTIYEVRGNEVVIEENGRTRRFDHGGNPLGYLKKLIGGCRPISPEAFRGSTAGRSGSSVMRW